MSRRFAVLVPLFALAAIAAVGISAESEPRPDRVPARLVTVRNTKGTLADVLADVSKQTGITVEAAGIDGAKSCTIEFEKQPFWNAMEQLAKQVDGRVVVRSGGKKVAIEPGASFPSAVNGPFRVNVRQVRSVKDFDTGQSYTELALDVHWEPRFEVYRISSSPTLLAAWDDTGRKLAVQGSGSKVPASGYSQAGTVRIENVPRSARNLAKVEGTFTVTASEKMLAFQFEDLTSANTVELSQAGVTARLKPLRKVESVWEAELELKYPAERPVFESFEAFVWATRNKARLIAPGGAFVMDADTDPDFPENPGRVSIVYRFTENPAKKLVLGDRREWKLVYLTPAPLLEYAVPFTLTDIPLP